MTGLVALGLFLCLLITWPDLMDGLQSSNDEDGEWWDEENR